MRHTLLLGLLGFFCSYAIGQTPKDFFQASDLNSFVVKGINCTDLDKNSALKQNTTAALTQIKADGFNTLRVEFNLNQLVRRGKYPYIDPAICLWIDSLSTTADELDLKLILTLRNHTSEIMANPSASFWVDRHIQLEHIYVWLQIAYRFKDNQTIIGYDILPAPTARVKDIQFTYIANELISAIRTRDANHLIFVNGLNKYLTVWTEADDLKLKNKNIALSGSFEYLQPFSFQKTEWAIEQKGLRFKNDEQSALALASYVQQIDSVAKKFNTPILVNDIALSKKAFKWWKNGHSYYLNSRSTLEASKVGTSSQSINGSTFGIYKFKKRKIKYQSCARKKALKKLRG